jgi:glucose-1-phosphate thymidylyltransferase
VICDYHSRDMLNVVKLGRGHAWLDTGTNETLLDAAQYIETVERRQGRKIACPEEIAYRMGFISSDDLRVLASRHENAYGQYLAQLLNDPVYP